MNQNEEHISKRDEIKRLSTIRNRLKEQRSETDCLLKHQTQRREKMRFQIETMKSGLKKFNFNMYRFLGKDHYPFETIDEKNHLFNTLERVKNWANEDYFKGQKKISEAIRKLQMIEDEIKVMKEDMKTIDSYLTQINVRIRNLSE